MLRPEALFELVSGLARCDEELLTDLGWDCLFREVLADFAA